MYNIYAIMTPEGIEQLPAEYQERKGLQPVVKRNDEGEITESALFVFVRDVDTGLTFNTISHIFMSPVQSIMHEWIEWFNQTGFEYE